MSLDQTNLSATQFVWWLRGYLCEPAQTTLTDQNVKTIREQLRRIELDKPLTKQT